MTVNLPLRVASIYNGQRENIVLTSHLLSVTQVFYKSASFLYFLHNGQSTTTNQFFSVRNSKRRHMLKESYGWSDQFNGNFSNLGKDSFDHAFSNRGDKSKQRALSLSRLILRFYRKPMHELSTIDKYLRSSKIDLDFQTSVPTLRKWRVKV